MSVYHKILPILATEMFRVYNGAASDILNSVLPLKPPSNCKSRNHQEFTVRPMKTVNYGLNSLANLGPKIWGLLPDNLKGLESIEAFKIKINSRIPENCPCRSCKSCIYQMGFLSKNSSQ